MMVSGKFRIGPKSVLVLCPRVKTNGDLYYILAFAMVCARNLKLIPSRGSG